jgi:hypothetical protein
MGKIFKFGWYCVKHAWRGCWTRANEQAGVFGGAILALLLYFYPPRFAERGMIMAPETIWGTAVLTTLMAAGSVILAFFIIFTTRLALAPARLYWEERERANNLSKELKLALKLPGADDTKWTIQELFQHIDPDYLDGDRYEKIGDDLRDALSTGRLTMWGRLKKTDSGSWVGPRAALTPIEKTYWYTAYFTWFFFHERTTDDEHCYADRKTGRPAYTDLQVNRSEALAVWPGEPDDIAENYANVRIADNPSIHENILGSGERQKFLGLLSAGILTAWARPTRGRTDFVRIPQAWWETHYIDVHLRYSESIENNDAPTYQNQSFLKTRSANEPTHYDVCVNRAQMSKIWRDLRFIRDDGSGA